jgi:hypothetical protein
MNDRRQGRASAKGGLMTGLLTEDELRLIDLTAQVANLLYRVIAADDEVSGRPADSAVVAQDWRELVAPIHVIQRSVMSQAAAREYPDIVRLLGRTIPSDESSSSDG